MRQEVERDVQQVPLTRSERLVLLMHEYDVISDQVIHWDQHLWRQSQFFVAVESAFAALIAKQLIDRADSVGNLPLVVVLVLSVGSVLNLFLCYVWFRVGRRNIEYTGVRYARAKALEAESDLLDTLKLYRLESKMLAEPPSANHGSRSWVMHIPSVFIVTWVGVLAVVAYETRTWPESLIPILLIGCASLVILVVERSGRNGELP